MELKVANNNVKDTANSWFPEICYEEDENGITSRIPFIPVPSTEEMPKMLFLFESRETGDVEPGLEGEEVPVVQLDLHQYADMAVLKEKLPLIEYDNIRRALGLEPLKSALQKGAKISDKVKASIE